jgi:signal transduction histidine kinase
MGVADAGKASRGGKSQARDELRLGGVSLLLVLLVWLLKSALGALIFGEPFLSGRLLTRNLHDLALFLLFAGCFLYYSRKVVRERAALEAALAASLHEAETERGKVAALNSELVRHSNELQAANRELECFAAAVSHDLRAPLTRIFCSSQALLEFQSSLGPDAPFFLNTINDGCVQMEGLIEALLTLSRVTEVEMIRSEVDLSVMAEELGMKFTREEPKRTVTFWITPKLQALGDPQLLYIALENLIGNAWKYTGQRERAEIAFGAEPGAEGETVFFLRDNGAGFDMEQADRLFKPFQRLHKQEFTGTGVGLATVQRIVTRHKGRVWGVGEPGRGATFYFTLNR